MRAEARFFIVETFMPTIDQLQPLIEKKLTRLGFDLVELKYIKAGKRSIVRAFIDKEGGVSIKDCEEVSHEVSILLDVENFSDSTYTLEVSSPGIDRLLTTEKDFSRVLGKDVKLFLQEEDPKQKVMRGTLMDCKEGSLKLNSKGKTVTIPLSTVHSGKVEVTFK